MIVGNIGIGFVIVFNWYKVKCIIFVLEGFVEEKILIMKVLGVDVRCIFKVEGMIGV